MAIPQNEQSSPAIVMEEKIVKVFQGSNMGDFSSPRPEASQRKIVGLATRLRRTKRRMFLEAVGLPAPKYFRATCIHLSDDGSLGESDDNSLLFQSDSSLSSCLKRCSKEESS